MVAPSFIHLRCRSSFSLSEGAIKIPDMVARAKDLLMPALAITDRGNLFGSLEFSKTASSAGIQPIIGCIVHVIMEETAQDNASNFGQLLLLAKNEKGYQNLLALVSRSYLEGLVGHTPTITFEDLRSHAHGLIALTGGPKGVLGYFFSMQRHAEAENYLVRLKDLFPGHLYMELHRHGLAEEAASEPHFLELAYKHEIPLVATNDIYFLTPDLEEAANCLICIADGRFLNEENRRTLTAHHYFKTPAEMAAMFADIPEALTNSVLIAQRCAVMSPMRKPLLPSFPTENGRSEEEELKAQAEAGLEERLITHVYKSGMSDEEKSAVHEKYFKQLDYELGVISAMKFPGYFLIVSDFIRWSKSQNIPVGPGRGSGAGSVAAWALQITDLDPLRFGLIFERFLNPERISMPDFDIDFCQERRDEVIAYVQHRYGSDRVAQIITFGKLQARAVLRDVGRVLQLPYSKVDKICKMVPWNPLDPVTLSKAITMDEQLQRERDSDESIAKLLDIGLKLEGLHRHASTHAAGVVIADRPLQELVPLYRDPRSPMPVTQYAMKEAEMSGLVKFDFLGLKTLTVLSQALKLLEDQGVKLNLSTLPLDDKPTYELLARGETTGVFQMESSGMRDALRQMKPDKFEDIIALISLYRPGPMENIPTYNRRKHGKEAIDYLHPLLENTLKETYGVIIYQEQVMEIARVLAGYSLGGADLLRRAMGKKIKEEMDAQREKFVEGAVKNKVDRAQAVSIFNLVDKFAGYGFNKSHAAAYALIGYYTAYLKANYPVSFLAASMNLDMGDTDKLATFVNEARRMRITVLPPHINKSDAYFSVEKQGETYMVRYALGALKGVGATAMQEAVRERKAQGDYTDIFDFAGRLDSKIVNKRHMESLSMAGAFDSVYPNRHELLENAIWLARYSAQQADERDSSQVNLFDVLGDDKKTTLPILQKFAEWPVSEKLQHEYEALGLYLSGHPLESHTRDLKDLRVIFSNELEEKVSEKDQKIRVAGIVTATSHRSVENRRFAYVQLSDPTGAVEIALFDENLISHARDKLDSKQPLLIEASARKSEGGVRIIADGIQWLSEAIHNQRRQISISLRGEEAVVAKLQSYMLKLPSGQSYVSLSVPTRNGMLAEIHLPQGYGLDSASMESLKAMPGVLQMSVV